MLKQQRLAAGRAKYNALKGAQKQAVRLAAREAELATTSGQEQPEGESAFLREVANLPEKRTRRAPAVNPNFVLSSSINMAGSGMRRSSHLGGIHSCSCRSCQSVASSVLYGSFFTSARDAMTRFWNTVARVTKLMRGAEVGEDECVAFRHAAIQGCLESWMRVAAEPETFVCSMGVSCPNLGELADMPTDVCRFFCFGH